MRKDDTDYKITDFRKIIHQTFCGKTNEDSRCPKKCPANRTMLTPANWGKVRIRDILEVKDEQ